MKIKLLAFLIFFMSITTQAQEWQLDLDTAFLTAQKQNFKVILVFSGSDWCAPCIKLEKDIWNTDEFMEFAQSNYVMVRADFPRKKQNKLSDIQESKNKALAEKYNPQGHFPLVVIFDKNKKKLGVLGYQKTSPSKYIQSIESL